MYCNIDLLNAPKQSNDAAGSRSGFLDDTAQENSARLQKMPDKAEEWIVRHTAKLETSKYILIQLTRNRKNETITIAGVTIHPPQEARYLGVIFDKTF